MLLLLATPHVQQSGQAADDQPDGKRNHAYNDHVVVAARLVLLGHCRIVMIVIVNDIDLNGGFGLGSGLGFVGVRAAGWGGCNT